MKTIFLPLLMLSGLFLGTLLTGCSSSNDEGTPGGEVAVNFFSGGIGGDVSTRASLGAGVTVRVLAYRHTDGSLSALNYAGENTYIMQPDGTLKADVSELLLPAETYDFYTVTPALEVDHSGDAPRVSVGHLNDYAVSLTPEIAIASTGINESQSVKLSVLERKCAQLIFQLNVTGAVINNVNLTKIAITEATVNPMADGPLEGVGTADLTEATSSSTSLVMDAARFATDADVTSLSRGGGAVLPKPKGSFSMRLSAIYNDVNTLTFEAAEVADIAFQKGYRYAFAAVWSGNAFVLHLLVTPWTMEGINADMGSNETLVYPLGTWTVQQIESNLGDGGTTISVSGWQSSSWSGDLGEGGVKLPVGSWTLDYSSGGTLGE